MWYVPAIDHQAILQLNKNWKILIYNFKRGLILSNLVHSSAKQKNKNEADFIWGTDSDTINIISKDIKLFENFITEDEENSLLKEVEPIFKRRRYQFDHWDGAIQGYKETEKADWNEENSKIIQRLREVSFPQNCVPMKLVHVLDLSKTGYIKPHIDSIKFCGSIIAGISLLSSSVMRLVMEENKNNFVDVLLKRRSLYIMSGIARYQFTHEILKDSDSFFKGMPVPRDHRISIICRNEPEDKNAT